MNDELPDYLGRRLEMVASDLEHGDVESAGAELYNVSVALQEAADE